MTMPSQPRSASSRAARQAWAIAVSRAAKLSSSLPPRSTAQPSAAFATSYLRVCCVGKFDILGRHLVFDPPATAGDMQFAVMPVQAAFHLVARPDQKLVDRIAD